jgi:hypothetical protein
MPAPRPQRIATLAHTLLALSRQAPLTPRDVAAILGAELGAARKTTAVRTEHDLAATDLFARGRLATANAWMVVSLTPAAGLGLVLQDLEPFLLDARYRMDVATSRLHDGPAIRTLDHRFLMPAGMLVVQVPPRPPSLPTHADELGRAFRDRWDTVAGTRRDLDPVVEMAFINGATPGLEKEPTLRAFYEQVRAAGQRLKPTA